MNRVRLISGVLQNLTRFSKLTRAYKPPCTFQFQPTKSPISTLVIMAMDKSASVTKSPEDVFSNSGLVRVTGPPPAEPISAIKKKRTILPEELLNKVTDLVHGEPQLAQGPEVERETLNPEITGCAKQNLKSKRHTSSTGDGSMESGCNEDNCKVSKVKETELVQVVEDSLQVEEKEQLKQIKKDKKAKKKNRKRSKGKDSLIDNSSKSDDSKRQKKVSPNYFIAVQVTNEQIHEKVKEMQKSIEEQEPKLTPAFIDLPTLHFTLMVMHLAGTDKIRAKTALDNCLSKLQKSRVAPLTLDIVGTGNFRNGVVFAKIKPGEDLDRLGYVAETVQQCFEDEGILSTDERGFKPHLTILKLSKSPKLFKKGIKKIDPKLYESYEETHFGTQLVDEIQLCSMLDKKDASGYYKVLHSGTFRDDLFKVVLQKELHWEFKTPEEIVIDSIKEEKIKEQVKENAIII